MLAALVLAALVLTAGLSSSYGRRGAIALAVLSVLWLLVNNPMEGPTLLVVTRAHGLTAADLAGLAGLGLAAWQLLGARDRSRGATAP